MRMLDSITNLANEVLASKQIPGAPLDSLAVPPGASSPSQQAPPQGQVPGPSSQDWCGTYILHFGGLLVTAMLLLAMVHLAYRRCRGRQEQRRQLHEANQAPGSSMLTGSRRARPPLMDPLPDEVRNTIPKSLYVAAESLDGEDRMCPICLGEYENGEEITILPCTHSFHPECVNLWFKTHSTCPNCRQSLKPTSESSGGENEVPGAAEGRGRQAGTSSEANLGGDGHPAGTSTEAVAGGVGAAYRAVTRRGGTTTEAVTGGDGASSEGAAGRTQGGGI